MAQAHGSALLKPMSADSLLRPDAARSMPATKKATPPPVNGPSLMHPPTFAPRPAPVRQLPPEALRRAVEKYDCHQTTLVAKKKTLLFLYMESALGVHLEDA